MPLCATPRCSRASCGARALAVEVAAEGKLKRALELANKLSARYTLIIGDNEIAAGKLLRSKNMSSGEQESVAQDDLASRITGR